MDYIDIELCKYWAGRFRLFFEFFIETFEIGEDAVSVDNIGWIPSLVVDGYNLGFKFELVFKLLKILYLSQDEMKIQYMVPVGSLWWFLDDCPEVWLNAAQVCLVEFMFHDLGISKQIEQRDWHGE